MPHPLLRGLFGPTFGPLTGGDIFSGGQSPPPSGILLSENFDKAAQDTELSLYDPLWDGNRGALIVRASTQRLEPTLGAGDCGPYGWRSPLAPTGDHFVEFTFFPSSGAFFTASMCHMLSADNQSWYEPYFVAAGRVGVSREETGGTTETLIENESIVPALTVDEVHLGRCEVRRSPTAINFQMFLDGVKVHDVTDASAGRLTEVGVPGVLIFSNGSDANWIDNLRIGPL